MLLPDSAVHSLSKETPSADCFTQPDLCSSGSLSSTEGEHIAMLQTLTQPQGSGDLGSPSDLFAELPWTWSGFEPIPEDLEYAGYSLPGLRPPRQQKQDERLPFQHSPQRSHDTDAAGAGLLKGHLGQPLYGTGHQERHGALPNFLLNLDLQAPTLVRCETILVPRVHAGPLWAPSAFASTVKLPQVAGGLSTWCDSHAGRNG